MFKIKFIKEYKDNFYILNKKFATLERRVGETLHVANDITLATASVTSVAQNIIFYVSKVIDITYIYKLSTKNFIS